MPSLHPDDRDAGRQIEDILDMSFQAMSLSRPSQISRPSSSRRSSAAEVSAVLHVIDASYASSAQQPSDTSAAQVSAMLRVEPQTEVRFGSHDYVVSLFS